MPKNLTPPDDEPTPVLETLPRGAPPPSSAASSALAGQDQKRPVEAWAEDKGMLPMEVRAYGVSGAAAINPEYWKFAGTRAFKRWADGQLVTEAEFDAAVAEQLGASHR